jgi:hypothetical protein
LPDHSGNVVVVRPKAGPTNNCTVEVHMYAYAFGWLKSGLERKVEAGEIPANILLLIEEALTEGAAFRQEMRAQRNHA